MISSDSSRACWLPPGGADHEPELVVVGVVEELANRPGVDDEGTERFSVDLVADPGSPASLKQHVELFLRSMAVFRGCLAGSSLQSRAPRCFVASCLARSVLRTPIWLEGRQCASRPPAPGMPSGPNSPSNAAGGPIRRRPGTRSGRRRAAAAPRGRRNGRLAASPSSAAGRRRSVPPTREGAARSRREVGRRGRHGDPLARAEAPAVTPLAEIEAHRGGDGAGRPVMVIKSQSWSLENRRSTSPSQSLQRRYFSTSQAASPAGESLKPTATASGAADWRKR